MNRTAIWDPLGSDRFLVRANDVRLYQWNPRNENINLLNIQSDLALMRSLAWCPNPNYDALIAVGMNNGRIDLLKLHDNITTSARLEDTSTKSHVSSLSIPHSRSCNQLSFSMTNPNHLAAGFDRVRGQFSLLIWDIESVAQNLYTVEKDSASPGWPPRQPPLLTRRHSAPDMLAPIARYGSGEYIASLTFLNSPHLLGACLSGAARALRLCIFDTRDRTDPAAQVSTGVATNSVSGLTCDPFDEYKLASHGDDGLMRFWDRRRLDAPILSFSDADAGLTGPTRIGNTVLHAEFSKARRGLFGSLNAQDGFVRLWTIMEAEPRVVNTFSKSDNGGATLLSTSASSSTSTGAPRSRRASTTTAFRDVVDGKYPVLGQARTSKTFSQSLASFAFTPALSSAGQHTHVLTVTSTGHLDISRPRIAPHHSWSALGDFVLSVGPSPSGLVYRSIGNPNNLPPPEISNPNPWEIQYNRWEPSNAQQAPFEKNAPTEPSSPVFSVAATSLSHSAPGTTPSDDERIGRALARGNPQLTQLASVTESSRSSMNVSGSSRSQVRPDSRASLTHTPTATPSLSAKNRSSSLTATRPSGSDLPRVRSSSKLTKHSTRMSDTPDPSAQPESPSVATVTDDSASQSTEGFADDASTTSGLGLGLGLGLAPAVVWPSRLEESFTTHSGTGTILAPPTPTPFGPLTLPLFSQAARLTVKPPAPRVMGPPQPDEAENGQSQEFQARHVLAGLMNEDISTVMRERVMAGYGLESMWHNATVVARADLAGENTGLVNVWKWMYSTENLMGVETSRVFGYDFAYHGILSVWEGFTPSNAIQQKTASSSASLTSSASLSDIANDTHSESHTSPVIRTTSSKGHRRPASRPKSAVEGVSARQQYETALETLNGRRTTGPRISLPKGSVDTNKAARRSYALHICKWEMSDQGFREQFDSWQNNNEHERAACWAVFFGHYDTAMAILQQSTDEKSRILAYPIQILVKQITNAPSDLRENPWREYAATLQVHSGSPYLRALLARLLGEDWHGILLSETSIDLRERLAIALFFLPDDQLTKYLRNTVESMNRLGDIEALIITGITPLGLKVLQAYIDNTGDVQSAAILTSYVSPVRWRRDRKPISSTSYVANLDPVERWVEAYENLLDSWKLFHHRCNFDVLRGEINAAAVKSGDVPPFEWVPPQIAVQCFFCQSAVDGKQKGAVIGPAGTSNAIVRATMCGDCHRLLPRCSVCLMQIGISDDYTRDATLLNSVVPNDTIDEALVYCQTCRHGGHSTHILDWFFSGNGSEGSSHSICAVADCECRCSEHF